MIQFQLKHTSISHVPFHSYAKDFTFVVNDVKFETSRIISDLISPKISQIHSNDPTFDTFYIKTAHNGDFSRILNLVNFEILQVSEDQLNFVIEVLEKLGIDSLKIISTEKIEITTQNVVENLQKHEKLEIFYSDQISSEIDFISKHFDELYENHSNELQSLSYHTIERIINNDQLKLKDEDQLLNYINELYKEDVNNATFYEYVLFKNVSVSKITEFLEIFNISDLTQQTWISVSNRLQQEIKKEKYQKNSRYSNRSIGISFKKEDNKDFTGIINYIKQTTKNIENEIEFTCSSIQGSYYAKYSVSDTNAGSYFASDNEQSAWVCLDFKNHRVIPTDYTIGTTSNSVLIRSWVLEGSEDKIKWDAIDSQENCERTNGCNRILTFKIQTKYDKEYKYIRLRTTGPAWDNRTYLRVNSLELYGTFI